MKNHAQAILLFTGYPLEPIVALEINKSLQAQVFSNHTALPAQTINRTYYTENNDERWFNNYE